MSYRYTGSDFRRNDNMASKFGTAAVTSGCQQDDERHASHDRQQDEGHRRGDGPVEWQQQWNRWHHETELNAEYGGLRQGRDQVHLSTEAGTAPCAGSSSTDSGPSKVTLKYFIWHC